MGILWGILLFMTAVIISQKMFNISDKIKLFRYSRSESEYPYKKAELLTQNEFNFYQKLKPITDSYGLNIIVKVRLADLVEVKQLDDKSLWAECFNKIKSKHIDFVIVEPDEMTAECLIELQDSSHSQPERIERDEFVKSICSETGLNLIMTYGETEEIEKYLDENWVKL